MIQVKYLQEDHLDDDIKLFSDERNREDSSVEIYYEGKRGEDLIYQASAIYKLK